MKILSRYIVLRYLRWWTICFLSLLSISLIGSFAFDFRFTLEGIDGIVRLLTVLLNTASNNILSLLLISVLFSSVLCLREFQQNNELLVLYSFYYSPAKIMRLLAVVAIGLGCFGLAAEAGLVHWVKTLKPRAYSGSVWRASQHQILHGTLNEGNQNTIYQPVLLRFEPTQKRLVMVMYAQRMTKQGEQWLWEDVHIRQYTGKNAWQLKHQPKQTMLVRHIPNLLSSEKNALGKENWVSVWKKSQSGQITPHIVSLWQFTIHQQLSHIASALLLMCLGASAVHPLSRIGTSAWALIGVVLLGTAYLFAKQAVTFLGAAKVLSQAVSSWSTEGVLLILLLVIRWIKPI